MAAKINRTGKTYGDLTVLETIPGSNSKEDTYLVKCNCCGNTMIIGINALLKGLKCKDCRGKDRKRTYQDLVGEEHNGIKVISLAEDAIGSTGHRNIRYNCMCSCGKEFVAYRSSLLRGKVKSCGCCKHITEASKMLVDNAEAIKAFSKTVKGSPNSNENGEKKAIQLQKQKALKLTISTFSFRHLGRCVIVRVATLRDASVRQQSVAQQAANTM